MAKFTQNEVWADTLRLTRAHWAALIAIAGAFNFLPTLLLNHFVPMGDPPVTSELGVLLQFVLDYYRENALWVVLQSFVVMTGSAAMLRLVFARGGTVGGALLFAIALYLLVAIPAGIMMLVIAQLTGIVFILATGQQFGTLLGMIVLCAMQALVSALLTMLAAAVYRALAPRKPEL